MCGGNIFSASTPILDLDTRQLSSLLYNLVLLKNGRPSKAREIARETPTLSSDLQDDDFDGSETSNLKIHPGTHIIRKRLMREYGDT